MVNVKRIKELEDEIKQTQIRMEASFTNMKHSIERMEKISNRLGKLFL